MKVKACPDHGPPSEPEHRFCEVCGRNLATGEPASVPTVWLSSRAVDAICAGCGAAYGAGGVYCDHCGRRRSVGRDHAELDLGMVAGVTDRGRRRRRNEDAVVVGRVNDVTAAVVCDGVSTSTNADTAAHGAAEAGLAMILTELAHGAGSAEATGQGARAAAAAARAAAGPADRDAPSCTYVSGIVTAHAVTVGWVGDSRAYWLGPDAACLTVDDSVAGQLAAGLPLPAGVDADPRLPALIRWLGADSGDPQAQVVSLHPAGPGRLLLCSDGLHHYLSDPAALTAASSGPPLDVARHFTSIALNGGGHDNIAVAVLCFPPSGGAS